ncbi:Acyl-CoA ligase M9, partial [Dissostichus eleginoides]
MLYSVGGRGSELSEAAQAERMDQGCLLGVQGEGMYGEDYQVFLPDGRAVGQVLVLGPLDPDAG